MLELPYALRHLLVETFNVYLARLESDTNSDVLAEGVVEHIETASEELSSVDAEDIIPSLEAAMEGTKSLVVVLSDHLESHPDLELTGEEIVQVIEKLSEIEWTNVDGEDDGAGFFGDEVEEDDY